MYQVIIVIHVLLGIGVIGFVLMQQGKGADAGAAFGTGSAGSVFGAQGAANFLSRTTAILATLFFITSLGLAIINGHKTSEHDIMSTTKTESDVPAVDAMPPVAPPDAQKADGLPPVIPSSAPENKAVDAPKAVEPAKPAEDSKPATDKAQPAAQEANKAVEQAKPAADKKPADANKKPVAKEQHKATADNKKADSHKGKDKKDH